MNSIRANVADGIIRATFPASSKGFAQVSLSDLDGTTVWSKTVHAVAGSNNIAIEAKHRGLRVLRIKQGNTEMLSKVYCP
jgi:hypothetical protein